MAGAFDMAGTPSESWLRRLADRWLALRDRLLASPGFQRRAAGFALTRPVARRRARELFDLVGGFAYSQVLLACVQLRVFQILADGPQALALLAPRLGLTREAARCLLDAAVALRLLGRRGGERYGLGPLGAPMVNNTAVEAMVLHHAALYADLADPVSMLRAAPSSRAASALSRYWAYEAAHGCADDAVETTGNRSAVQTYSELMAASQPLVADEILDAFPLQSSRCLLDVGGGDGSFLISAGRRAPALQLMLFDLPAVGPLARARLAQAGLAARARVVTGSFLDEPLPLGADVVSLVRVIHDHDDGPAMTILQAVRAALPSGGTLLLAEPMADTPGAEAVGAYFGFYLRAMGRGRPRSADELTRMLQRAGFACVQQRRTRQPLQAQLLVAS
ncbi:MAG: acetylserotonin O-methyltransferase [Pseudomonadota bacterium]|nr:acetylserotonin O-methyltransferase [Pseudomonadota bacterium]